jgi:putative ABC transport system permease protein
MIPLRYNLRSLGVRKTTTLATAFGVALVVFVLASTLMLSRGVERTLSRSGHADNAIVLGKGADGELVSAMDQSALSRVLAETQAVKTVDVPGGRRGLAVGELVVVVTQPKASGSGVSNVLVRGVPEESWAFRPEVRIVDGRRPTPGTDEVAIGQAIRGRFVGMDLGESFELRSSHPVTVVGVFEADRSSFESEVWADLSRVRSAFGRETVVSSVRVRLASHTTFEVLKTALESDKTLKVQVLREAAYYERQSEGLATFIKALGLVIAIFFSAGAMIGAAITMYSSVAHRRREIGVLRSLGFSRAGILGAFVVESAFLALAGGVVGALASLGMGLVSFSMINLASWSELTFSFEPTTGIIGWALGFAVGMGILGGLLPALRAVRTPLLVALRA